LHGPWVYNKIWEFSNLVLNPVRMSGSLWKSSFLKQCQSSTLKIPKVIIGGQTALHKIMRMNNSTSELHGKILSVIRHSMSAVAY